MISLEPYKFRNASGLIHDRSACQEGRRLTKGMSQSMGVLLGVLSTRETSQRLTSMPLRLALEGCKRGHVNAGNVGGGSEACVDGSSVC